MGSPVQISATPARQRSKLRAVLLRLSLVFISLLFIALLGEIALRVSGWPAVGLYDSSGRLVTGLNPGAKGGRYREMGQTVRIVHYDYDVTYAVNSHGLAEREPAPKAPGEYRISVMGDSFTMGVGVRVEDRYTSRWLNTARDGLGEGVTLWNMGAAGSGTFAQAQMLTGVGAAYQFDEVVLAFYAGNDLFDNELWKLHGGPEEDPSLGTGRAIRDFLRSNLRLVTFLWYYAERASGAVRNTSAISQYQPGGFDRLWPATSEALDTFRTAVGDRPLTVWYLPSPVESHDVVWEQIKAGGLPDSARLQILDAVKGWCDAHGVTFVDLTPSISNAPLAKIQFLVDPHWTAEGHRLIAEGLAAHGDAVARQRRSAAPAKPADSPKSR